MKFVVEQEGIWTCSVELLLAHCPSEITVVFEASHVRRCRAVQVLGGVVVDIPDKLPCVEESELGARVAISD